MLLFSLYVYITLFNTICQELFFHLIESINNLGGFEVYIESCCCHDVCTIEQAAYVIDTSIGSILEANINNKLGKLETKSFTCIFPLTL